MLAAVLALSCSDSNFGTERQASIAHTHEAIVMPSGGEAQPSLPWGGRLQAIALDPADPAVVIAASDSGGLFRTADSGSSWERLDFPSLDTDDIRFCPFDRQLVVLTTVRSTRVKDGPGSSTSANDDGIWISRDHGSSWARPTTHLPPAASSYIGTQIAFGQSCSDIYIGTDHGLAISHDAGDTFSYDAINGTNAFVVSAIAHPGVMPADPPILDIYTFGAGSDPAGVRRSTTGGGTWTTPRPGTGPAATALGLIGPQGFQALHSLAVSPIDGNVLFATSQNTTVDAMGQRVAVAAQFQVYESDDGGDTWTSLNAQPGGQNRVPMVFATTSKSGTGTDVYWGDGTNVWWQTCANTGGLRCTPSTNNPPSPPGWLFINLIGGPSHPDPSDMAFAPDTHCPLYLATDGGLLKSTPSDPDNPADTCGDTGTWAITRGSGGTDGLNALQLFQVAGQVHDTDSTDLYFATMDNGIWGTINSGMSWTNSGAEGQGIQLDHYTPDRSTTRVNTMQCANCVNRQSGAGLLGDGFWKNAPFGLADDIAHAPGQLPACPDRNNDNVCDTCVNRQADGTCDPVGPNLVDFCNDLDNDTVCDGMNCVDSEPNAFCDPLMLTQIAGPSAILLAPALIGGGQFVQWDGGYTARGTLTQVPSALWRTSNNGSNWEQVPGITFPPAANPGYRVFDRPRAGASASGPVVYQPICRNASGCFDGVQVGLIRITNAFSGTPQMTDVDIPGGSLAYESFDSHGSYGFDPQDANQLIAMNVTDNTMRRGAGSPAGVTWTSAGSDPGMNQLAMLLTRNGEFWFNAPGAPQVQAIEFDPTNGQRIVVGTHSAGVVVSLDAGNKWSRLCKSEQIPRVRSFFFDDKDPIGAFPTVYASSYGRGLWKLDLAQRQEPVFTVPPAAITGPDCGAVDIGSATAIDECEGVHVDTIAAEGVPPTDPAYGCSTGARPCGNFPLNTPTNVTWTARDVYGDTTTTTQTVTVTDTTGPMFTLVPPDVTTTTCSGLVLQQPTAADSCGGTVTFTNDAPSKYPLGTTVVTWTAHDARGNTRTATQRVTVLLGDDATCCPAGTHIIQGTPNNDLLNGTSGSDCILGKGGQDTINGNGGNDFISGGDGNDVITGGLGNDVIFGGSGQDNINGNDGNDTLYGGDGDDTVAGGAGDDVLHGGQGQDTLQGQDGNDQLFGDDGYDTLQGGNGDDVLAGGGGDDHCDGGAGTNVFEQCEFGAPNSCADLVQNGTETAVDCGGGCPPCDEALSCLIGSDCLSNVCAAGTCQTLPGGIAVLPVVDTDFGSGYCVHLNVTNVKDAPTMNWTASVNTNQSTIYTSWKGNFSGSSGVVNVTPALPSNQVIGPDMTDGSIGFCANRNVSGSGVLPFVVSASATY